MKVDILAIGIHPDDVELSCCGTLLQHIARGRSVGLLDLSQGELGTRGSAALRLEEAAASAKIMGAVFRENLGIADGLFQNTTENKLKIVEVIRRCQPTIVLANALRDRHPDHARAAQMTSEACFLAGLVKIETFHEGQRQERWRPQAVYHYIQDYNLEPDFVVDISDHMEQKMDCILAFASQFYDPKSKDLDSPISGKDFLEFIRSKNRMFARAAGFTYAEGFNVGRTIGVKDLFDLS
ncbi:MAG: bacillithiol biosynthesis deacetylase BshB1 [Bacteroidota bacterium]